jgi:hypothetical protein
MCGLTNPDGVRLGPMTLLGAIELDDKVLFAADGVVYRSGPAGVSEVRQRVPKAWRHPRHAVAWGFTGDESIGLDFNRWIQDQEFKNWSTLIDRCNQMVASLNGNAVRLADIAGTSGHPIDALVAGYMDGAKIVHLYGDGTARFVPDPGQPLFLGGGFGPSYVAWESLKRAVDPFDPETNFRLVIETAIDTLAALGGPAQYLEMPKP